MEKEKQKIELNRKKSGSKRNLEEACDVGPFVGQSPNVTNATRVFSFACILRRKCRIMERCGVCPDIPEASPELILYSSM